MENYREMNERQKNEVHAFLNQNCFFAFSKDQFGEGRQELKQKKKLAHLPKPKELTKIPGGGFMLKSDVQVYAEMSKRLSSEKWSAIDQDKEGTGYCLEMFRTELPNYEFGYTGSVSDCLYYMGIDTKHFDQYPQLLKALNTAAKEILPYFSIVADSDEE